MIILLPMTFANPPEHFTDLRTVIPDAKFEIRYSTAQNFTQRPLPGYESDGAWLLEKAAKALVQVQRSLTSNNLSLIVYDAYRPIRASAAMYEWAKKESRLDLFRNGYIAKTSGHNHGHSIDVGLWNTKTDARLDMGTEWDTFDTASHTLNATGIPYNNRMLLKLTMEKFGFKNYSKEWWHYTFPAKHTKALDIPYKRK